MISPSLFGLSNSNRDFSRPESWGKNIFNNAFPMALACYMSAQNLPLIYLKLNHLGQVHHDRISVDELLGMSPFDSNIYYAFERDFLPYQPLVFGSLPRTDVVILNHHTGEIYKALELKLTALPDNSTAHLSEDQYGSELVIRPDTIVYLALSLASLVSPAKMAEYFENLPRIANWGDGLEVIAVIPQMLISLENLMAEHLAEQTPFIMQPIWKTERKTLVLHPQAFDIFVWSNFAFTRLFFRDSQFSAIRISRGARSVIWLSKMLIDFSEEGKFNPAQIIDELSYHTKNDKAFAVNGQMTHPFLASEFLAQPRVPREAVREIILGEGHLFLSPERRLDAVLLSTPNLFGGE